MCYDFMQLWTVTAIVVSFNFYIDLANPKHTAPEAGCSKPEKVTQDKRQF